MSENNQNSGGGNQQSSSGGGDGNKRRRPNNRRRRGPNNRPNQNSEQKAGGANPNRNKQQGQGGGQGGGGNSKNSNSRRRRGGNSGGQGGGQGGQGGGQGNRKTSNASGRKPNRLSNIESLFNKYENLKEQYLIARSKYYHQFHRAGGGQLKKIKNHYFKCLEQLQRFKLSLSEYQERRFAEAYDPAPYDTTYSESVAARKLTEDKEVPEAQVSADTNLEDDQSAQSAQQENEHEAEVVKPTPARPSKALDPHMTRDQLKRETFLGDSEESVGTMDDYQAFRDSKG
jgi:hypothetical protein